MAAGTIALTNNSTAVTGTGTTFTSDLAANDFMVSVVGGVTYTLGVKSIESDTALTLITAYNGPTSSGLAWSAVANQTLVGITAQIAADVAKAIRGLNLDKTNWQQVFTGTGTITVNLPDGTSYSGPAWNSITASLNEITSSRNSGVSMTVGVRGIITQEWIAIPTIAIGQYNSQVIGGVTYYTHFYKFSLPNALPNAILTANAQLVGALFGSQAPEYQADLKVRRDNDAGTAVSNTTLVVSVKTTSTGWVPTFNLRVTGF